MITRNAKIFLAILLNCWLFAAQEASGQLRQPTPHAAEILASIDQLNVLGTVLYFAAHPDDENTRLIAWLANERGYHTAYLSLTRGDGGQNLIGTELAEELGLIRTQELLQARSLDGGVQLFSSANDFGFSKTPEETLAFWDKESILADAVWIIRTWRPDVIITRFPADARGGHGHHQAATLLAIEAFSAAADPTRFPEQLQQGAEVWQATRLLWNTANFGGQNNTSPEQFQIDIGEYNPLIGKSYGEIAAESRSMHKTQGFGAARQRGTSREYFETLAGTKPVEQLMDGVNTSWERISGGNAVAVRIEQIASTFNVRHPEHSLEDLLDLYDAMQQLPNHPWKAQKINELKSIILAVGGIWFESYAGKPKYAVGDAVLVRTDFIVRRPGVHVELHGIEYHPSRKEDLHAAHKVPESSPAALTFNTLKSQEGSFIAKAATQPYWLRAPKIGERYQVAHQEDIGHPGNQDDPSTTIWLGINNRLIPFDRSVVYKSTHPVHGEIYQPLTVAPPVTANVSAKSLVFANGNAKELDVVITSHMSGAYRTRIRPQVPPGWSVAPAWADHSFSIENQEIIQRFTLRPPADLADRTAEGSQLSFVFESSDSPAEEPLQPAKMIRQIELPHIPRLTYYPPAAVALSIVKGTVPPLRIGYVPGAGDLVPEALRSIGLSVDILTEKDLIERDLSEYDAIIAGVRAYNVHPKMTQSHERLMEYVKEGGNYLVQYQVNTGLQTNALGPYPFKLSRLRVTDERAPVRFALPESPVLNYPNRITEADFDGWIQERGLYFVVDADPAYEKPLSMNDPGEQPLDGSLLIAKHGKGRFVYTSLAFFRQLPAGVPGAYRLFMNLLAKPETEE